MYVFGSGSRRCSGLQTTMEDAPEQGDLADAFAAAAAGGTGERQQ